MHTLRFWMLALVQVCIGFAVAQCYISIIPHMGSLGVDVVLVSNVLSIVLAAGSAVGAFTSGLVYDRFGLRKQVLTIGCIQMVGIVLACMMDAATPASLLILSVFCIGYGNAMLLGILPHMINHAFGYGRTNFGALFGWLFRHRERGAHFGLAFCGHDVRPDWIISGQLHFGSGHAARGHGAGTADCCPRA